MSTFDDRFLNVSTSQPQPDDKHFNRDKDPSPVLTAERAVAEAEARPRPFGIPPEEMAELNVARRSHSNATMQTWSGFGSRPCTMSAAMPALCTRTWRTIVKSKPTPPPRIARCTGIS